MEKKEYETPDEYKRNLAHLAEFHETREGYRNQIRDALARGSLPPISSAAKTKRSPKLK